MQISVQRFSELCENFMVLTHHFLTGRTDWSEATLEIKGSIEPTHGSVCSDVKK